MLAGMPTGADGPREGPLPEVPAGEQPGEPVPPAVRTQILSTEHWSLLATRGLSWNESFSRASWFMTVVSATVVALALVADSTDFGVGFRVFALLIIPLLVIIGLATVIRLVQLDSVNVELVIGMNRLRRGYLDIAPDLEHYFVTGHREDIAAIMRTYGGRRTRIPATQYLTSIALLVTVIVAVLVGALAGLVADAFGVGLTGAVVLGIAVGLAALTIVVVLVVRHVRRTWDRRRVDEG
jgi:small-conductance mechanosensitive channel